MIISSLSGRPRLISITQVVHLRLLRLLQLPPDSILIALPFHISDMEVETTPSASDVSSTKATIDEFTLFPVLPAEIRLKIWNEALSEAQKVVFEVVQTPFACSNRRAFLKRITSVNPLLHVCQESREEFLFVYFGKGESTKEDVWDIWRYFRFGLDICELRNDSRVPWTFLFAALGERESYGLELVLGRKEIPAR